VGPDESVITLIGARRPGHREIGPVEKCFLIIS
jgi:hypothetical protein